MPQLVYMQPNPGKLPILVGEIAPHDRCDEEVDEDCVPVRFHGRTMSVPLAAVKPVR